MTAGDPGYEDAVRRLERLAERLRVVGPRLAAREGPAAQQVLRDLRAGLQRLADLAADADGEPRRAVPELAAHALGDQVLVLGHDLLAPAGENAAAAGRAAALEVFENLNALL